MTPQQLAIKNVGRLVRPTISVLLLTLLFSYLGHCLEVKSNLECHKIHAVVCYGFTPGNNIGLGFRSDRNK